ncbi:hypothetical protein PDIG_42870 [Penicillium digitatum PHI26]|uniref:Uncharacterized protein n=2 Tax=Penicillium digitatum TaxID=36651 RepID=K9GHI5_PEND2|nr:hypothetical protein PDIP_41450 [Penicillium digitatum Pd1]EKV12686.1 hypothetical protein PDIG_42870 [Penicillium digitatum PHI26]EKV15086.1 hypothetical protein PDIP_41450 [Penicillium digitatum Pd1]
MQHPTKARSSHQSSSHPLTSDIPSKFQPSVYKSTDGKHFAEPAGNRDDYYWITVHFPPDIDHRGIPDSAIMLYVRNMITKGHFTVDNQAMHGFGKKCLSIPIKRDPETPLPMSFMPDPTHPDLLLAENLAGYWKDQIAFRKVTLDQRMIFGETRHKVVKLEDMLDVGVALMDPWRI